MGLVDALLIISFAKAASDDWWLAAVFFAVVFLAVNFAYFTNKRAASEVLVAGAGVPGRLPDLHDGVHGLRLLHQLRLQPPGRQGRVDRLDPGEERRPGGELADLPVRADRQGRHGLDAVHRPGHGRDQHRYERGTDGGRRCRSREGRRPGHRRQRLRDPQPRDHGRQPRLRQAVEGPPGPVRRGGGHLPARQVDHPGLVGEGRLRLRRRPGRHGLHDRRHDLPGRRRQGQLHQRGRGAAAARLARQRRLRQLHQAGDRRHVALTVPADHWRGPSSSRS